MAASSTGHGGRSQQIMALVKAHHHHHCLPQGQRQVQRWQGLRRLDRGTCTVQPAGMKSPPNQVHQEVSLSQVQNQGGWDPSLKASSSMKTRSRWHPQQAAIKHQETRSREISCQGCRTSSAVSTVQSADISSQKVLSPQKFLLQRNPPQKVPWEEEIIKKMDLVDERFSGVPLFQRLQANLA